MAARPDTVSGPDTAKIVNAGFNAWLAALPQDEASGEWIEEAHG